MSKEQKTYFTLIDGKRIRYPLQQGEHDPEIFEVRIQYREVDRSGYVQAAYNERSTPAIHVPRSLFKEYGLALTQAERKEAPKETPPNIEDLLLQLLEHCGVFDQR